ncbi:tetratricopeptide (TPR) repeat protein [Symbiobacterium terraclitae]|uniref:Tetratricopeptide (TPR) repeat protein n=1 Tax=Symbiobacterium terraclitae TaxID=557451 RepID=A0ABS4JXI2_9FIRM|nr:hypothetical protein [Symbiobacterium terraclitae]MBP2019701.1 tetratricopeptide (TPR) repeat protein [Symbiobacterium terraclitae]
MPLSRLRHLLEQQQYREARLEGERLIHQGTLTAEELARAYKGTAVASYYQRDIFAAIKLGEYALTAAEQSADQELITKCRYDLAEYYAVLGDYPRACDHLLTCLNDLQYTPGLVELEARVHHNLALIFRYRRQYDDALGSHHLAVDLLMRCGNWPLLMEGMRGIVYCHLARKEPEEALAYIQNLEQLLEEHPDDQLAASLLTDWAYYYQQTGDLKRSMQYCTAALSPGSPGVDDHVLATAAVIAGENALILERYEEARVFANLAEHYALEARQAALMNRATALRRRLHEMGYVDS